MKMKLCRQIKTVDYLDSNLFDLELTKLFNNDTIRIVDIQYRVYVESNQVHYVAFIIYEYSKPDEEDSKYDQGEEGGE